MPTTSARCVAYGLLGAGVVAGGLALGALAPIAAAEPVAPIPAPAPATPNAAAPAAATVTPAPAATPDGCQASKMTRTVGGVVENAAKYLETHPDVDQAFTDIKAGPQDQIAPRTQAFLVSRPDVAGQFGQIAAPLNDLRNRCGLPLDLAQGLQGGGLNPAAMGVNPAMLQALSQNPTAQAAVQNPAVQAALQSPTGQAAMQNPSVQQAIQGAGPLPGPTAPAPVGSGPAPGPVAPAPVGTGPAPGPATPAA